MNALATRIRRVRLFLERLEDRLVFAVDILIDAAAGRHLIDPLIYGSAFADPAALADLNLPINRSGGNGTTRYNWQQNASNHAADWFFESISDGSATPGASADSFIGDARNAAALPSLTVPTIGWVAKLAANRDKLASFSVAKYGAQQATDWQWMPDAGNGVRANGTRITGNDPNDANMPADVAFQRAWIEHIVSKWGSAASGGPRFFAMDNEPSIWHETHRDVHPTGATMEEVRDKILAYGAMVKAADPGALVLGPEEWGWSGYLYSGYDLQYGSEHGWSNLPDRAAHGNMDYLPWLLDQLHSRDVATGQRILDYFTVHYYPQSGEFSNDVSRAMQELRNRSTRSLWDPNYTDASWINDKVRLVPRLRDWVNTYYPGTKTGITEYNWGAEGHMNGATAQADILGIFGRESLDLANRWTTPAFNSPAYLAMKLYRNYDGQDGAFGDTSVSTTVPNPDQVSAFSAVRSADGSLTVMVVNKNLYDSANPGATTSITLNLSNFQLAGNGQAWRLAATNAADQTRAAITRLSDVTFGGNSLTFNAPMQSVTLFVLRPAQGTAPAAPTGVAATASAGQIALTWNASAGATSYNVYRGTTPGGEGATPYRTGLTGTSFTDTGLGAGVRYYYQVTAVNAAGESGRSAEVSAATSAPPAAPTGVAATPSAGQIALTWAASSGATSYNVYRATSPGGQGATPYRTGLTGTSFTDTGLPAGARYYYQVTAVNAAGESGRSAEVSAATPTPPAAPANVAAAPSAGQIALTWSASSGATSYSVYRGTTPGGEGATPYRTGVTATSFTDTGLPAVTTYYYQVTAVNAVGESGRSAEASATTPTPPAVQPGVSINPGGAAAGAYVADRWFTGGATAAISQAVNVTGVAGAAPQAVYRSYRHGNFVYAVANLTPGATYVVRLHFAEPIVTASGRRRFDVFVNGGRVMRNFDIFAAGGGRFRAVVREVLAVADGAGKVTVRFAAVTGAAVLNGLQVLHRPVLAVAAGGTGAGLYGADAYFTGGTASSTTAAIDTSAMTDPAPASVYQNERYGAFQYTLTGLVAGRAYTVRLDFAEIYWDAAGQRVFDVKINGALVLNDFDVFRAAGGKNRAVRRQFTAVADTQGRVVLSFESVVNFAKVSGIAVY